MITYTGMIEIHNKDLKYAENTRELVKNSGLNTLVTMWGNTVEIRFDSMVFPKGDYMFGTTLSQLVKNLKKKTNTNDIEIDIRSYQDNNVYERVTCHYTMIDGKLKTSDKQKIVFFDYQDCM